MASPAPRTAKPLIPAATMERMDATFRKAVVELDTAMTEYIDSCSAGVQAIKATFNKSPSAKRTFRVIAEKMNALQPKERALAAIHDALHVLVIGEPTAAAKAKKDFPWFPFPRDARTRFKDSAEHIELLGGQLPGITPPRT